MLIFNQMLSSAPASEGLGALVLDHEQRRRGRLQAQLVDGTPVGVLLPRGAILHDSSFLATESGEWCVVRAQLEAVSIASAPEPGLWVRAAYHLGNRHVALELGKMSLIYLQDSQVDKLCVDLGLSVARCFRIFDPEKLGSGTHVHSHHLQDEITAKAEPRPHSSIRGFEGA